MKQTVVLGVTGGIAVYKALDIVSQLRKKSIDIHVIMTEHAMEFVRPLAFQSLSSNMVIYDMFEEPRAMEIQHISLAKKADVMLVAPATANIIGKVANGIADDMLSTTIMATKAKVIFAPAMNTNMYENPIVQRNIKTLKELGYEFIEPDSGILACGDLGKGKLAKPELICEVVEEHLNKNKDLCGKKVIITAGPTISKIDPVRFISNNSSGKMGYEIAREARDRGGEVVLISGPTNLSKIPGIKTIDVLTNKDMKEAVLDNIKGSDLVIKAAAVADYKIESYSENKIKKQEGNLELVFERDTDILKLIGNSKRDFTLVGFAAESENLLDNAKLKLKNKNLDYIVANDISNSDTGFKSDFNKVTIISKDEQEFNLEKMSKREVAKNLFDIILKN